MKEIKYKLVLLFIFLFINYSVSSEGFIAGTLVKTKNGYIPIEQLKENDSVISYSFKNKELYESKILKIKKQYYSKSIKIKSNNCEITIAPDHKFYSPLHFKKRWIVASELKPKDSILRNIKNLIQIDEIVESDEADFYCLSIEKYHNFFVTQQDIFVHNFAFTIPIFTWVIGEGIVWAGLGTWCAALTAVIINEIAKNNDIDCSGLTHIGDVKVSFNNNNQYNHIINNPDHGFLSNANYNGPDPDEWWKKIIDTFNSAKKNSRNFPEGVTNINTGIISNDPKYGELIVRVFKVKGMMKLSTAFLKMLKR